MTDLTQADWEAIHALIGRHLPLRRGRDYLYVSPEMAPRIPMDLKLGTQIDPRLRGTEMRLQRPCR
jgi:hypothetical protein